MLDSLGADRLREPLGCRAHRRRLLRVSSHEGAPLQLAIDPLGELLSPGLWVEDEDDLRPLLCHLLDHGENILGINRNPVARWDKDGWGVNESYIPTPWTTDGHQGRVVVLPAEVDPNQHALTTVRDRGLGVGAGAPLSLRDGRLLAGHPNPAGKARPCPWRH